MRHRDPSITHDHTDISSSNVVENDSDMHKKEMAAAVATIQKLSLLSPLTPNAPDATNTSDHSTTSSSFRRSQSPVTSQKTLHHEEDHSISSVQSRDHRPSRSKQDQNTYDFPEFALKTLHKKTLDCPKKARRAASDLHSEVSILSDLQAEASHPNIIRLYGISADFYSAKETVFIVLEKLEECLENAIVRWKNEASILASSCRSTNLVHRWLSMRVPGRTNTQQTHLSAESQARRARIVALDLASAMAFVHSHNIMYRDLKPANIGFSATGKVKLFDFASSKRFDGQKFRHRCGTLRYMAHEVARKEPYSFPSDVYSFGMVLWEVLMLEKPYATATERAELTEKVIQTDTHPSLKQIASTNLKRILWKCWREIPEERPSFSLVHNWLALEFKDSQDQNGDVY